MLPGFWPGLVRDLDIRYLLVDLKTAAPELLAEGGVLRGAGVQADLCRWQGDAF